MSVKPCSTERPALRLWLDRAGDLVWAIGLGLCALLVSVGQPPAPDAQELRVLETAQSMLEGQTLTPADAGGAQFVHQPPLSSWVVAMAFKLAGQPSLEAAHLLVASLGGLLLLATYFLAQTLHGRAVAWKAAGILAASVIFVEEFRRVSVEAFLVTAATLAIAAFAAALRSTARSSWPWFLGGYIGLALALLANGPLALVIVGLGVGCVLPEPVRARRPSSGHVVALGAALAPLIVWTAAVDLRVSDGFTVWSPSLALWPGPALEGSPQSSSYGASFLKWMAPFTLLFLASLAQGGWRGSRWRNCLLAGALALALVPATRESLLLLAPLAAVLTANQLHRWDGAGGPAWLYSIQASMIMVSAALLLGVGGAMQHVLVGAAVPVAVAMLVLLVFCAVHLVRGVPHPRSLLTLGMLLTLFYSAVLQVAVPKDLTPYNMSWYLRAVLEDQDTLCSLGNAGPAIQFFAGVRANTVSESTLEECVEAPNDTPTDPARTECSIGLGDFEAVEMPSTALATGGAVAIWRPRCPPP